MAELRKEGEAPIQISDMELFDETQRIVKGWGTVEIVDKEGDFLPMSEFKQIMPIIMKRGGNVSDRHSNRVIGKILNRV